MILNQNFLSDLGKMKSPLDKCELLKWKSWWFLSFFRDGGYALRFISIAKENPELYNMPADHLYGLIIQEMNDEADHRGDSWTQLDTDSPFD